MKIKLLYTFGAMALGMFSTNSFSQTTPFIPQVKDWGTYIPITTGIPIAPSVYTPQPILNSRNDVILTWLSNSNDQNSSLINSWMDDNSHQNLSAGGNDLIICSIAENGSLNWTTYLGGEKDELQGASVIDINDNIYVVGTTYSSTGIATEGAFQTAHTNYYMPPVFVEIGGISIEIVPEKLLHNYFISKFNSEGNLLWSTYFSGNKGSVYSNFKPFIGNTGIYISGRTLSSQNFATAGSLQPNWPENVPSVEKTVKLTT